MTRRSKRQLEYDADHRTAKFIVAAIVCILLISGHYTGWIILDIIGVFIWFFGVNSVAYVVEEVRHHSHKHGRL